MHSHNSDGTPTPVKHRFSKAHIEELNEDYFFCDGNEIEPAEYFCDMCGEPFAECECEYEFTEDDLPWSIETEDC